MPDLNVTFVLPSGGAPTAEVPDDVSVRDLLAELTSLLELPTIGEGVAYTLDDEMQMVGWTHNGVEDTEALPLVEANAVVRSLSLAMHSQSKMFMPLLALKRYDQCTTTHATNVAVLSMALAEYIGLGAFDVREFGIAGLLHDLGKVRVPKRSSPSAAR